jgi:cytochrome c-type biogenesis protein CcmH/NrfG
MKKIITTLTALIFMGVSAFAQNAKFNEAMKANLVKYAEASTPEDRTEVINTFERIAEAEPKEWLPWYYVALHNITSAYQTKAPKALDALLDKAEAAITKAEKIEPKNSELFTLKAMLNGARIMVDPMSRWQKYGAEASKAAEIATKLDPTNPRVMLYQAQSIFYRPEAFGGGKVVALPMARSAIKLFEAFKPSSELMPNWGADIAKKLLEDCEAK